MKRAFASTSFEQEKSNILREASFLVEWGSSYVVEQEIQNASQDARADRDVVLAVVKVGALSLERCSWALRDDAEVVMAAVATSPLQLEFASQRLQNDKAIVQTAVRGDGRALKFASGELQADREVVLQAVDNTWQAFEHAGEMLQLDKTVMMRAVQQGGRVLKHACEDFRADSDIVFEAVSRYGEALQYASPELQTDRRIVRKAVQNSGEALAFASEVLQHDHDIVLEAVKQAGNALQHASPVLRDNKEIVLAAVEEEPMSFKFVGETLKEDRDVVAKAVSRSSGHWGHFEQIWAWIDPKFKVDKDIVLLAVRAKPDTHFLHERIFKMYRRGPCQVPEEYFYQTRTSKLAIPGESAPILAVTLMRSAPAELEQTDVNDLGAPGGAGTYIAEACLLSGCSFSCELADQPMIDEATGTRRAAPNLNDLAKKLHAALVASPGMKSAQSIFIMFVKDDGDSVGVTAWDWERPLSEFL